MIAQSIHIAAVSFLALSLSYGLVSAQSTDAKGTVGDPAPADSRKTDTDTQTPEQLLADATGIVDKMKASADNIGRMLRTARDEKDVVKILCLDDKLNQMNVAARSAGDRLAGIEAAVNAGNAERAQHEGAVLAALTTRSGELSAEANQCIGQEKGVVGGSTLEVRIDPAIPKTDTASPAPTTVISAPPTAASPTI